MEKKKIIAINRMFAGDYIQDEQNIGHEIINLFKTDNGDNFIYLQPYGNYSHVQDGRFESILLVRGIGKGVFEIMGKAEELLPLPVLSEKCGGKRCDDKITALTYVHTKQLETVKELQINYGGVSIDKLYKHNKHDEICIYATFKANKVRLPKKALYITDKANDADEKNNVYYVKTENGFAKQNLKMYFEEETDGYKTLKSLIETEALWEEENTTERIGDKLYLGDDDVTFLDVIKKSNDELAFSNLIAYYLTKYKPLMDEFIKEFCPIELKGTVKVYREKYHIDVLLQDEENNFVIIENKIKSGINGLVFNTDGNLERNQLKTYVDVVSNCENVPKDKIVGLVLLPNYSKIDLGYYEYGERYKKVTYKQLYEFFAKYALGVGDFGISDKYYIDFIKALKRHSKEVDNTFQEDMKARFVKSIILNKK